MALTIWQSGLGKLNFLTNLSSNWFPKMAIILCLDNAISGLDFNPSGTLIATIDCSGVCLISDVNTDDYSSHFKMGGREGNLLNFILLIIAAYLFSIHS